jgi:hypothetical protein
LASDFDGAAIVAVAAAVGMLVGHQLFDLFNRWQLVVDILFSSNPPLFAVGRPLLAYFTNGCRLGVYYWWAKEQPRREVA